MNASTARADRLALVRIGSRELAISLAEVAYFARASECLSVAECPSWMAGVVRERGTEAWLPVVDLSSLWHDTSLSGPWSCIVATRAGLAIGVGSYNATSGAASILPVRPALEAAALRYAAMIDGRPIPLIDPYALLPNELRQSLSATA